MALTKPPRDWLLLLQSRLWWRTALWLVILAKLWPHPSSAFIEYVFYLKIPLESVLPEMNQSEIAVFPSLSNCNCRPEQQCCPLVVTENTGGLTNSWIFQVYYLHLTTNVLESGAITLPVVVSRNKMNCLILLFIETTRLQKGNKAWSLILAELFMCWDIKQCKMYTCMTLTLDFKLISTFKIYWH